MLVEIPVNTEKEQEQLSFPHTFLVCMTVLDNKVSLKSKVSLKRMAFAFDQLPRFPPYRHDRA